VTARLNPDAMPFVPRFAFTSSPSTEMRLARRDSEAHTVIQYDSERYVFVFKDCERQLIYIYRRPWLTETTSADDIAFLIYFGLIDLPLP
jgi:hypothetical protein